MPDTDIRVICGPTGAGKSAIAMSLAERHPVTIISADSRQVYRGFDIGTAKPSAEERRLVPHRGIDVAEPTERYSAAAWAEAADRWVDEARADGRLPLVVGGTGFYLRALFGELFDEPALDARRRLALEQVLAPLSGTELRRWAERLDPERAHLGRAQLLRVIEIALLTGHRLSALHRSHARPARRAARYLVVDPGDDLAARIAARVEAMFAAGWEDEVRRLIERVPADAPAWNGTGYRTIHRLVRGEVGPAEARAAVLVETRQYAKRQRTWFRHQLPPERVTRIDPAAPGWPVAVERWFTGEGERAP